MAKAKQITKQDIIASAEGLLTQVGVADISLADIANAMGISKGTLYYHYTSKDDIIFDIIVTHINEQKTEYMQWLARHPDDMTVDRFLSVMLHKGVKLFNRAKIHIFLVNECLKNNELRVKFIELIKEWHQVTALGVNKAFANAPNKDAIASMIMIVLDGLIIQEVLGADYADTEDLINLVKQLK